MTRACDRLILSGTADPEKQSRAAPRRPAAGLDRARAARRPPGGLTAPAAARPERAWSHGSWDGRPDARPHPPRHARPPSPPTRWSARARAGTPGTALPARPKVVPGARRRTARAAAPQLHRARPVRQVPLQVLPRAEPETSARRRRRFAPDAPPGERAGARPARARRRSPTGCSRTSTSRGPRRRRPPSRARDRRRVRRRAERRARSRTSARSSPRSAPRRCAPASPPPRPFAARPRSRSRSTPRAARSSTASSTCWPATPDGSVLVVDYKSDRLGDAEPAEVVERDYATQRIVYALAALRDGAPAVEVAYAFLERPDAPVSATFTTARRPRARRAPHRARRGRARGPPPVAAEPHRALCGDCPGRATLCSWPEAMTLREPAAGRGPSRSPIPAVSGTKEKTREAARSAEAGARRARPAKGTCSS